MPFVNINSDIPNQPFTRKGRRRIIPRHVIRDQARNDFLDGATGFSCTECHINYAQSFGRMGKYTSKPFQSESMFCLDCLDKPEIAKT